jgi:anti-anti-sigma factor
MIEVTEYDVDDIRIIGLQGTLDAPNTMQIEEDFRAMLAEESRPVIIDLSGVDFVSSYGLRMLLTAAQRLQAFGGLHLSGANEHVLRTIKVAGYNTMFPVFDTVEQALDSLS